MYLLLYILIAYFLGSIPWGYLVAKFKGVNIQKRGSGNIGATNVYRTLGLSYALLVFLLDTLKGVLVMLIVKFSLNSHIEIALVALAVILGHTFSIFLKGRGGKGVATTLGVLLVLIGFKVMFSVVLVAIGLLILTRFMSLTSLILIWIFPGYFVFVNPDLAYFVLGVVVTVLIYWEHRDNIDRLKEGRELKLAIKVGLSTQRSKSLPIKTVPSMRLAKIEKSSTKEKTKKPTAKTISKKSKTGKKVQKTSRKSSKKRT